MTAREQAPSYEPVPTGEAEVAATPPAPEVPTDLDELLKRAEAEAAELKDAYLRARAETENIRKQSQVDLARAQKYAIEKFAEDLLPVKDALEQTASAGASVTLDTLKELRNRSTTFVGMKHAVNDLGFVSECRAVLGEDFKVFVGLEELSFPMMAIGACGLMNAVGNLRPRILAELCEAVWRNDLEGARKLHQELFEINQAVFFDTNPIPIKYMMKRLGLTRSNEHRLPMVPATPELERRLDGVLQRAGLTGESAA